MSTIAKKSFAMTGLFEAEVLTELLLWRWEHPLRNDREFRRALLEDAATALRQAIDGEALCEEIPAEETNLIAALYFVEWSALQSGAEDADGSRRQWLVKLRRSLPSCFCAQEDLPPE